MYLRRLEFTDERYPLAYGLRVGGPAARLIELFGPPASEVSYPRRH